LNTFSQVITSTSSAVNFTGGTSGVDNQNILTFGAGSGSYTDDITTIGADSTVTGPCTTSISGDALVIKNHLSTRLTMNRNGQVCVTSLEGQLTTENITINSGSVGLWLRGNGLTADGGTTTTYPWYPSPEPTCTIGAGGTSCSTTVDIPHSGMECTANLAGTSLIGGLVGEVLIDITDTTETLTYATPSLAGGGVITFHNICN
jgi:hypothetical protein